jgi:hypothetical protein
MNSKKNFRALKKITANSIYKLKAISTIQQPQKYTP